MSLPKFYCDSKRPVDLIAMGRVAVDLYATDMGSSLKDAQTFKKYLGGCAGNIAVGCARLGLKAWMFSCVGQDEMGAFIKEQLQVEGVGIELVREMPQHLTGLVLLGINPPHHFPLIFYRNDCADMQINATDISDEQLAQTKALLITGTGLSTVAMNATTHEVVQRARQAETQVILDLDYRPVLWGLTAKGNGEARYQASAEVSAVYQKILPLCDLIVGTAEEICIAGGEEHLNRAIAAIQQLTPAPIVLKQGEEGAQVIFSTQQQVHSKPFPVEVVNVLGAGDGFMAGLLSRLLQGASWEEATQYANAAGALVVTRHGCAPAIPFKEELAYFIAHYDQQPRLWDSLELAALHRQEQTSASLIKNKQGFSWGCTPILTMKQNLLNFSVVKLKQGENYSFNSDYEFAALLMTGKVRFSFAQYQEVTQRYDYFYHHPKVLHCPAGISSTVEALTDCEVLLFETENEADFAPILFDEHNSLELDPRGKDLLDNTAHRLVRTVFDKRNRPQSHLVLGEIISQQGRWSSYPSHHHPQPELYHYRFSEPQGFAFAEHGEEVSRIEHYDTYNIKPGHTHAHCTAPGYALYTLWVIRHLPENPYWQPQFVTEHEWTRQPTANLRAWRA